ncbi:MAG: helix-hairpin-helix domain-containing protein [Planctomycetota bacterium]|nr:helix-hairpin-helix domain-containing protein [Planctomycetota bacterium]
MALLCTLHGDGPATLKTLRRSGLTSLESVAGEDAPRLADLLGIPAAAVRRLQKEALILAERCGVDQDREEAPPVSAVAPAMSPVAGHSPGPSLFAEGGAEGCAAAEQAAGGGPTRATASDARDAGDTLDARDRALVRRVMARAGAGQGFEAAAAAASQSAPYPESGQVTEQRPTPTAASPVGEVSGGFDSPVCATGLELAPGRIETLDGDLCRRLFQAGVHTIPELCQANALELGRTIGLGFSRMRRLQFLARRQETQAASAPVSADNQASHADKAGQVSALNPVNPGNLGGTVGQAATGSTASRKSAPMAAPPRVQLPRFSVADSYRKPAEAVVNLDEMADEGAGGPFAGA